jgi:phosphatidylglycerol:prolipoprotein diacylglycerol transferase
MHPILFHLPTPWGPQPVFAYGLLLSLSILLGWQLTVRLALRHGAASEDVASSACLVAAVSGLLGGRALYVLVNGDILEENNARWFELTSGGSMAFGGFLAGFVALAVYLRIKRVALLPFADVAAPALALGTGLTRIGCYLYGCDFGTRLSEGAPSWLKSLGTFPRWSGEGGLHGSPALFHHLDRYGIAHAATHSLPVHPTQLYEAMFAFGLLALTLVLLSRKHFHGQVIAVLGMLYAAGRFALEYIRDEPDRGEIFGFSGGQLGAILLLAAAAITFSANSSKRLPAPTAS